MNLNNIIPPQISALLGTRKADADYGPIGIDIGSHGIRLVQFCNSGDSLRVSSAVYAPFPSDLDTGSDSDMSRFVRQTIKQSGCRGRKVVSCLRDSDTSIFMLNYLLPADKDDEASIAQRMQERLEGDISEYVIDYMMIRSEGGVAHERSALVAVASTDTVIRHLEILRRAGMDVTALEIEPMAIRRLISVKHLSDSIANMISISIGKEMTYLTVLSGRRLIYEREIEFGEQDIIDSICKTLDMSHSEVMSLLKLTDSDDALSVTPDFHIRSDELKLVLKPIFRELVEDINKALIYAASETRGMDVRKIYLTGTVSRWGCIISSIQSMVEVETSVLTPFDDVDGYEDYVDDTRNTVAAGLALRNMTEVR